MMNPVDFTRLKGGRFNKFYLGNFPDLKLPDVEYPRDEAAPPTSGSELQTELALDFGTSAITAALVTGNITEILRFGGREMIEAPMGRRWALLNSSLGENYRLTPIVDAPDSVDEEWEYYPCLKRRIEWLARTQGESSWEEEAVLDVAAVCWLALRGARDAKGQPAESRLQRSVKVYLAVPNTFPRLAVEVVKRGVSFGVAGLVGARRPPVVETILEAEAVAYGILSRDRLDEEPPQYAGNGSVLVLDAGAGTTDATIVRVEGQILKVVAHAGLPVGGLDLDAFIASQRTGFDSLDPFEMSHTLRVAREAKELYWSLPDPGDDTDAVDPARHRALAEHLATYKGFAAGGTERPLEQVLADGHRRYLALAVRALLDCLPRVDLDDVQKVIVSGRASLLMGFHEQVKETLLKLRSPGRPKLGIEAAGSGRGGPNERKFAVVRGVAAYAGSAHVRSKRRPIRATFDVVLQRPLAPNQEVVLVPAGHPLLDGWGVRAWHVAAGKEDVEARQRVDMRLIPRRVLRSLVEDKLITEAEMDDLLAWSAMPILKFDATPPFKARIDYDFFTLQATAEVNGHSFTAQRPPYTIVGQLHPVHHQSEDWFERSHTRREGRNG